VHGHFALLGRQRRFCMVASLPRAAKQWQNKDILNIIYLFFMSALPLLGRLR
jgi:hypothetical protein